MGVEHVARSVRTPSPRRSRADERRRTDATTVVQAKLRVGDVHDPAEREADAFAEAVMRALAEPSSDIRRAALADVPPTGRIRRSVARPEVGAAGGELAPDTESRIRSASTGGTALPQELRRRMSPIAGDDLSSVRVHTGPTSDNLNRTIQARAFTTGDHIHFADGAYDPGSAGGQRLIAHEVGHTLQQGRIRRSSADVIHR